MSEAPKMTIAKAEFDRAENFVSISPCEVTVLPDLIKSHRSWNILPNYSSQSEVC